MVVRTDRVGDLILSTPFMQGLRDHFPDAQITAWVSPYCDKVLDNCRALDRVTTSQPDGYFDLAISLAPRSESLKNTMATGAPVRVGYVYKGRPLVKLLAHRCLTHVETVVVDPPNLIQHEVEHLDRLARLLGMPPTTGYPLDIGHSYRQTHDWLVLHLGDRWFTNGWTLDDIAEVAFGLEAFGRLVVTAGPREAELLKAGGLEHLDLRTDLRFDEWCRLIGEARALVTPDTGAVHVAAALGTPVVAVYEPDSFEHCSVQWRPWMVEHRQIRKLAPEDTLEEIISSVAGLLERRRR